MKNIFTIIIAFAVVQSMNAQQDGYLYGNTPMQVFTTSSNTPDTYTGSPYVEKDFTQGVIIDSDGKTQPAFLRYNAVEDLVEVRLDQAEENTFVLPKVKNITYTLNGYTYVLDSFRTNKGERFEGYFIQYFDGDKVDFYARPLPDVREAQKATTGYGTDKPAHLEVKMEYYIATEDGILKNVKLKSKDFINELGSSKEVKKYFKTNKVKSLEDYVKFLDWYEEN